MDYAVREWRKASGLQPGMVSAPQTVHDPIPSPTVSASRKKPKTSQSVASLSLGAPSPALPPSMQPSSSGLRRGPPPGARTKKPKSVSSKSFWINKNKNKLFGFFFSIFVNGV